MQRTKYPTAENLPINRSALNSVVIVFKGFSLVKAANNSKIETEKSLISCY